MSYVVPTPAGLPLFGNTFAFGRDVLSCTTTWARLHGDVVRVRIPGLALYQVTHPEHIDRLLVEKHRELRKDYFTRSLGEILGGGLLVAEGERWRGQRRLVQPAFQPSRMRLYADAMLLAAEELSEKLAASQRCDVSLEMMRLTARVVAITLFGSDVDADTECLRHAMEVYSVHFAGIAGTRLRLSLSVPTPSARRVRRAFAEVDAVVARLIEARRRDGRDRGDLLSILLAARDERGQPLSDRALRDETVTMLLAGHETSALVLTYALHLLARHPDAQARIHSELDAVLDRRRPCLADLQRLSYTMAVLQEAMRLYPPVWTLGRELLHDVTLGAHTLPRGAAVMLPQWVVHRDPRWFERPLEFVPERWLPGADATWPRGAYFPFGTGPRMCIGKNFALLEAALVLATLLRRWRVSGAREPLALVASATLRPATNVVLDLAPRHREHRARSLTDPGAAAHR